MSDRASPRSIRSALISSLPQIEVDLIVPQERPSLTLHSPSDVFLSLNSQVTRTQSPTTAASLEWKTIGMFGGFCLLANNITGPGMVQISPLFQQSGWLFSSVFLTWTGLVTGYTSLLLAAAMARIPGNGRFQIRTEFEDLAAQFLPRWAHIAAMFFLIFNFQATNISSIVVSAQTMDHAIISMFEKTCGLIFYPPRDGGFKCVAGAGITGFNSDSPFGNDDYVISAGYFVVMLITLPLGIFDLDNNIWVQKLAFFLLTGCMILWMVQFCYSGLEGANIPLQGTGGYASAITTIIFNYGFVITVPSWINEKKERVSVEASVWGAVGISTLYFLLLGFFGGASLQYNGSDLISALTTDINSNILLSSKIAAYVFPFAALLTSIPIYSIIIRYNLLRHKIVNKLSANLFAVVFPWVIALLFYVGDLLNVLITWSSAILFVVLNMCLPLAIYLEICRKCPRIASHIFFDDETRIKVFPKMLRINELQASRVLFGFSSVLALTAIVLQIVNSVDSQV